MWLILVAVVGMLVPGGLSLYWLVNDYSSYWRTAPEPKTSFDAWWRTV